MSCSWRRVGFPLIWMDDPCSFTSCCQVLDSSSQPWIPSGQSKDFGWSDLPRIHLDVINRAWFEKRERWMNISASSSLILDYCTREWSWHISLWNTRCDLVRCWAVIKRRNPFRWANFTGDTPGISMAVLEKWRKFFSLFFFFFWCNTTVKEKKVRCVRSTFLATVALSKPADLSALNACAPERGGGVKTNGRHQL